MPSVEKTKRAAKKALPAAKKAGKAPAAARAKSTPPRAEPQNGNGNLRQQSDGRGKYVYCIIQATEPLRFGPLGIGADPAEVHTVNYRDIAAVVSDTPIEVHDPTRENVLAHERVNETVMRKHTVIPMSFGTVFKTRDDIFEALRDVAVASRANKPIGDKMIMNAAFLVSRDKEQAFDQRVKEIGARFDKLTFKYTGPWPPYNFVNIRLKLERAKEK